MRSDSAGAKELSLAIRGYGLLAAVSSRMIIKMYEYTRHGVNYIEM